MSLARVFQKTAKLKVGRAGIPKTKHGMVRILVQDGEKLDTPIAVKPRHLTELQKIKMFAQEEPKVPFAVVYHRQTRRPKFREACENCGGYLCRGRCS